MKGGGAQRVGALVRRFRRQAGLTQQEVADLAGMSVGGLRDLEQGRVVRPRPATLRRLAAALRLPESDVAELARQAGDIAENGPWLRVLGPLTVLVDGVVVDPGSVQQRALLGLLALFANRPVSVDALAEVVWEGQPPAGAAESIQSRVSRLRQRIRPRDLVAASGGYQLSVTDDELDLLAFRRLVERARRARDGGDAADAFARYQQAVQLWRGEPLADVAPLRTHPALAAVDREWRTVVVEYADAAAALGRHDRAIPLLRRAIEAEPLDEATHARLITALAGSGEPAAALAVYHHLRRRLADELGVDPGPELQRLHRAILRGEPAAPPAPAAPAQLPAETPDFTGRRDQLARLDAVLEESVRKGSSAICVLSGTAGVGKTSLAVRWAHRVRERFPDGQLYVNLRGFDPTAAAADPGETVRMFLDALGVPAERVPAQPDAQAALYRSLLTGRRILVVLDNARDAAQVRPLLPGSPGCLVVVTSRSRLTGLVAAEGARPIPLDLLSTVESRQLIAGRLGAGRLAAEPDAVDEIVDRCARLPLALAVAAARAATYADRPLSALAAELRGAGGSLDAFDSEDSVTDVRTVLSLSYRALSEPAARLFRLLSAHPWPEVASPAAASLAGAPVDEARRLLDELTRAQLVTEQAPDRFSSHDLLRAYAAELARAVETEVDRRAAERRLVDHFLHTASAATLRLDPHQESVPPEALRPGAVVVDPADRVAALEWFAAERPALMAVLRLAADAGFDRSVWQLAYALDTFVDRRGLWHDQIAAWEAALVAAERLGDVAAQAEAHRRLGHPAIRLGREKDAEGHLRHALDRYTAAGNPGGQADTHRYLAHLRHRQSDLAGALEHAQHALALYRVAGDQHGEADALNGVGWHHALLGDHAQAVVHCEQALALLQRLGDRRGEAGTWDSLGYAHHHLHRYAEAAACYRRAIAINRDLGDRYYESLTLTHLGDNEEATGDRDAARAVWREALAIVDELGHPDADQLRARLARP